VMCDFVDCGGVNANVGVDEYAITQHMSSSSEIGCDGAAE
jgi:hypothetical protein